MHRDTLKQYLITMHLLWREHCDVHRNLFTRVLTVAEVKSRQMHMRTLPEVLHSVMICMRLGLPADLVHGHYCKSYSNNMRCLQPVGIHVREKAACILVTTTVFENDCMEHISDMRIDT